MDTTAKRTQIYHKLNYSSARGGRMLTSDLEAYSLMRFDRLESSTQLVDVGNFESTPVPFTAIFWRSSPGDRVQHLIPLLDIPGVGFHSIAVDLLHAWYLGCLAAYIGLSLWTFLEARIFSPNLADMEPKDHNKLGLLHIRSLLWAHYKKRRNDDPDFKRTGSTVHHCNFPGNPPTTLDMS